MLIYIKLLNNIDTHKYLNKEKMLLKKVSLNPIPAGVEGGVNLTPPVVFFT